MKKSLFVAFMSALMLFVCGCGDSGEKTEADEAKQETKQKLIENGWYPIDGGYINLRNVSTITSSISILESIYSDDGKNIGAITAGNIRNCKHGRDHYRFRAFIAFDNLKVYLPEANGDKNSKDAILDSWLETINELEKILIELKK